MGMLKYLDNSIDKLIDNIDANWLIFTGDKRDNGFNGLMSAAPNCIAYHLLAEGDIANNSKIPLAVRLALFNGLVGMVAARKQRIKRGGKFGLFVNVSSGKIIRTSDCKLNIKVQLFRITDALVRIDLYVFRQSKRHQDTLITDERYELSKTIVLAHSGEIIKVTEVI